MTPGEIEQTHHVCEDCCPERFAGCYCTLLDENERLREAMRAAMDATGTGTLHYHLLRDALAGSTRTTEEAS